MAIRLKVLEERTYRFKAEQGIPIFPNEYTGAYTVTPTQQTQVLETENLMMTQDVTVNPIPSYYGLITWDGAILTVS